MTVKVKTENTEVHEFIESLDEYAKVPGIELSVTRSGSIWCSWNYSRAEWMQIRDAITEALNADVDA